MVLYPTFWGWIPHFQQGDERIWNRQARENLGESHNTLITYKTSNTIPRELDKTSYTISNCVLLPIVNPPKTKKTFMVMLFLSILSPIYPRPPHCRIPFPQLSWKIDEVWWKGASPCEKHHTHSIGVKSLKNSYICLSSSTFWKKNTNEKTATPVTNLNKRKKKMKNAGNMR